MSILFPAPAPKPLEPRGATKLFALAKLDYLCISFCDVSDLLANVFVRDLEVSVNDRASRTTLRARYKVLLKILLNVLSGIFQVIDFNLSYMYACMHYFCGHVGSGQ